MTRPSSRGGGRCQPACGPEPRRTHHSPATSRGRWLDRTACREGEEKICSRRGAEAQRRRGAEAQRRGRGSTSTPVLPRRREPRSSERDRTLLCLTLGSRFRGNTGDCPDARRYIPRRRTGSREDAKTRRCCAHRGRGPFISGDCEDRTTPPHAIHLRASARTIVHAESMPLQMAGPPPIAAPARFDRLLPPIRHPGLVPGSTGPQANGVVSTPSPAAEWTPERVRGDGGSLVDAGRTQTRLDERPAPRRDISTSRRSSARPQCSRAGGSPGVPNAIGRCSA
jgi:hypothetical protein